MKRTHWTERQLKLLRDHYADTPMCELIEMIGRTEKSIYNRAHSIGLKKSPEALRKGYEANAERMRINGNKGQFKPGFTPWNKGIKGLQIGGEETRFKKGHLPSNHKPIGTLSWRKEYWYRKVDDRKWVLEHRRLWEKHNGPIPKKHVVSFKDGNVNNITLQNLECMPMKTNAIRNSVHRYPEDIRQAIRAKAVLTRIINKHEKE